MPRLHVFADEAGCFTFARGNNISNYFILATVTMEDCTVGTTLMNLRRKLVWDNAPLGDYFHATTDQQAVRDAVFGEILKHDFHVQATVMEKCKAQPQTRIDKPRFYQYGWLYHFRFGAKPYLAGNPEAMIVAASLGTRKERASFENAVTDVMNQTAKTCQWKTNFCPAGSDPCLQVADYCAWAIQRKWERGDSRSYDLIKDRIKYEYELFGKGKVKYY